MINETDAHKPSPMLPASFSSCLPETLYRLRSRSSLHLPMPLRSLVSHIVSASFSLLVEGKRKITIIFQEPPCPQKNKTRHDPGLPLLKDWLSMEQAGSLVEPAWKVMGGKPLQPLTLSPCPAGPRPQPAFPGADQTHLHWWSSASGGAKDLVQEDEIEMVE